MNANKQENGQQKIAMAARIATATFFEHISHATIASINLADFTIEFPDSLSRREQDYVAAIKLAVTAYVLKVKAECAVEEAPVSSANPRSPRCLSPSGVRPTSPLSSPCAMPLQVTFALPVSAQAPPIPSTFNPSELYGIALRWPEVPSVQP